MGACATKPKDLKGEAPEAAPENVPAVEIAAKDAVEVAAKDVVVVAEEEVKKEIEGLDDEEDAARRRSLSNLFKENEKGKGSEQVNEEASQITQASGPSEGKPEEVEKVVDAPVTSEIEKALEVASITAEAPKVESSEEKKVEEVKSEAKAPAEKEVKLAVETPAEKKVDEVKPAVETTAEKKIEEAPAATDAPKSGAPMETKAEEEKPAASEVTVIEEKKSS